MITHYGGISSATLSNRKLTFNYGNKISGLLGADFGGQSGNTVSVNAPGFSLKLFIKVKIILDTGWILEL